VHFKTEPQAHDLHAWICCSVHHTCTIIYNTMTHNTCAKRQFSEIIDVKPFIRLSLYPLFY